MSHWSPFIGFMLVGTCIGAAFYAIVNSIIDMAERVNDIDNERGE